MVKTISPKITEVYIEKVRFYDYLFIHYCLRRGYKVYVFDFENQLGGKRWVMDLIEKGLVQRIVFYLIDDGRLALEAVEDVYRAYYGRSKLICSLSNVYASDDVKLVFKKDLTKRLSNYFAIWGTVSAALKDPVGKKVILASEAYFKVGNMLRATGNDAYKLENVCFPVWVKFSETVMSAVNHLSLLISFLMFNASSILFLFFKSLFSSNKKDIKKYQHAIAITNPAFQFKFDKNRSFDFLVDNDTVSKENTLFLSTVPLRKVYRNHLAVKGYDLLQGDMKNVFLSWEYTFSFKKGMNHVQRIGRFFISTIFHIWPEKREVIKLSIGMIAEYMRWNLILGNCEFCNFISFNDEGFRHISRNILLKEYSCKTWMYAHSSFLGCVEAPDEETMGWYKHWLWSYLLYDNYLGWSKKSINYMKSHRQKIANYIDIGCLWSSCISSNGLKLKGLIGEEERLARLNPDSKIIAVFDTSYVDSVNSLYTVETAIKFYSDILKLLDNDQKIFLIVKEKKPQHFYSSKDKYVYSRKHNEYSKMLGALRKHPRTYLTGDDYDPSKIMSLSDLVITHAFSSSTIEALAARKKAIFYDPTGELRESFYNDIPSLVAHSAKELGELVHQLLYETSAEKYNEYLNRHILGTIEDFLDKKAVDRFRECLVKN